MAIDATTTKRDLPAPETKRVDETGHDDVRVFIDTSGRELRLDSGTGHAAQEQGSDEECKVNERDSVAPVETSDLLLTVIIVSPQIQRKRQCQSRTVL